MRLYGQEIPSKEYTCSFNNSSPQKIDPYCNLYIRMTDNCQANCKFCTYHSPKTPPFDFNKFEDVLKYLKEKKVKINNINFTGGEPALYFDELQKTIAMIRVNYPKSPITVNTNGFNLDKIHQLVVDAISLSRHHYDDKKNQEIFGTDLVPNLKDLDLSKVHLRCNLIKGYIDSQEELIKYIDEFAKFGGWDFGFVSLMPLNVYCKKHFIDYSLLKFEETIGTKLAYFQTYPNCSCKNFIHYTKRGELAKVYSRNNENYSGCDSSLVFNVNELKIGFNGAVLI
jgi:molybdenum cofactor biosynthesis enzyme MoaA